MAHREAVAVPRVLRANCGASIRLSGGAAGAQGARSGVEEETVSRRRKFRPIVSKIGSAAFCDNGAMITYDDIDAALDADRSAGFRDPTTEEVDLLVFGDDDGRIPRRLMKLHPALNALLTREMT